MFNAINLEKDNVDDLCLLFDSLLNKRVSIAAVTKLSKKMKKEFFVIKCIQQVRPQVESLYPNDVPKQIHEAYNMIVQQYGKVAVQPVQVTGLWNTKISLGGTKKSADSTDQSYGFSPGIITKSLKNYTEKTIKEVSIHGNKAISVSKVSFLKKAVYDFIISNNPSFSPKQKGLRIQTEPLSFREGVQLKDGRYIEGWLSFDYAVKQCKKALKQAGYSENDIIIGYN